MIAGILAFGAQDKREPLPKRGDTVVVTGCVTGGRIESDDITVKDGAGRYTELVRLRLTGDKKLLERIKAEHDGHEDVLTGVLKSDLPRDTHKRIANTRIGIGLPSQSGAAEMKAVPAFEVTGIEHTETRCR